LASLILVVNVVGELQQKRTFAASRGFLAAARLSCLLGHTCAISYCIVLCITDILESFSSSYSVHFENSLLYVGLVKRMSGCRISKGTID